jgi:hypothetical protein
MFIQSSIFSVKLYIRYIFYIFSSINENGTKKRISKIKNREEKALITNIKKSIYIYIHYIL